MKKRIIALVLVMVMLICALPAQCYAFSLKSVHEFIQSLGSGSVVKHTITYVPYGYGSNDFDTANVDIPEGATVNVRLSWYTEEYFESFTVTGPKTLAIPTTEDLAATDFEDADKYEFYGYSYWFDEEENVGQFIANWKGCYVPILFTGYDRWDHTSYQAEDALEYGSVFELDYNGGYDMDTGTSGIDMYFVFGDYINEQGFVVIPDPVKSNAMFLGWEYNYDSFFGYDFALKAKWKNLSINESYKDCDREYHCAITYLYDVDEYAWYHDGVHFFIDNDILINDNYFYPDSKVTKEDLAVALYKLAQEPELTQEDYEFCEDISISRDAYDACVWAITRGIIQGDGDGDYDLYWSYLTREEACTMIYRYEKLMFEEETGFNLGILSSFIDVNKVSSWARNAMSWLTSTGIIKGQLGNRIGPQSNLTKAELATIIVRLYELNNTLTFRID